MLCLVDLVGTGSERDPWRAPDGWDGSGLLDLRGDSRVAGQALAWMPSAMDRAGVRVLGASLNERPSQAARRHFEAAPDLGQAIAARVRRRVVCERHGVHRVFVGGRLAATWPGVARRGSVQRTETWPTLGTDITVGQDLGWAHLFGVPHVVAGVPQRLQSNAGAGAEFVGRSTGPSGTMDTDDTSVQATADVIAPTGDDYAILGCRKDDSATDTYYMVLWRRGSSGARRLVKKVAGFTTDLATGDLDVAGPLVLKVQADGSTIRAWVGAWDSGPVTDTEIPTGRCAIVRPRPFGAAQEVEIYGDVVLQDLGFGASIIEADGSSAGIASVNGVAAAITLSDGQAPGVAVAAGVAAALWLSSGESDGIAAVGGVGSAIGVASGAVAGSAQANGGGIALALAEGVAAGVATVSGDGEDAGAGTIVEAEGAASGAAGVTGIAGSIAAGVGMAAGQAVVLGQGRDIQKRRRGGTFGPSFRRVFPRRRL